MRAKTVVKNGNMNQVSFTTNIFLNIFFLVFAAACVLPLVLVISVSLTSENSIALYGYSFIPYEFSMKAYEYIFKMRDEVLRAYGITIFVTIVGTIISTIAISMYAYPLSRNDFRYKKFFSFMVFFTLIFNSGLVPWYVVYAQVLHLKDNIFVYMVPMIVNTWYVLIMRTFYKMNLPDSILEAARIDGAGELTTYIRIVLPLSLPGIATISLFQCLNLWNDWFIALMFIENNKLVNLQFLLYKIMSTIQYLTTNSIAGQFLSGTELANMPNESARMAMAVVVMGPIILVYPFFQKYFIKGLTMGAVKG